MDLPVIVPAVLLTIAIVVALALALRPRRSPGSAPQTVEARSQVMRLEHGVVSAHEEPAVDLDTVMANAGVTLYIPVAPGGKYLVVAHPDVQVDGRSSNIPTQLAGVAVAGQAGLEAMIKAGKLTGRLVIVDDKTAKALKAGTMVKDKAGDTLAIIKGARGFGGVTRIKPLSSGLVKSASAGPAVMSAIAMQAQLAQVEKAIGEVRDTVNAVKGYLEAAEQASVEGRRETLTTVYRTAQETGQMTQSLWDQIQDLEAPLRRDVSSLTSDSRPR